MLENKQLRSATDGARIGYVSRRDYVLLPTIFILTILATLAGGEVTARMIYAQDDEAEPCEMLTPAGFRFQPSCTSHTKVWEGPWITQHFNDCGYASALSCTPPPAGATRVVVVGSSTARGALVNYQDSFAGQAQAVLSKQCGSLVDFQNLGTNPPDVDRIDQRMPEALALHPAAIIMTVGTYDLMHLKDPPFLADQAKPREPFNLRGMIVRLRESRLFSVMQYYLYRDPAFQVRAFLLNGDPVDYLRTPLSAAWQQRVADFGDLLGRITGQAGAVPVSLFLIPERAQVALAGAVTAPPGVDPFLLGTALRTVATQHGVRFFDMTRAFAEAPDFQTLFYSTDGHAREGGHAIMANVVEQALLSDPAFARCLPQ